MCGCVCMGVCVSVRVWGSVWVCGVCRLCDLRQDGIEDAVAKEEFLAKTGSQQEQAKTGRQQELM